MPDTAVEVDAARLSKFGAVLEACSIIMRLSLSAASLSAAGVVV
jgi:hypothetical protein